MPALSKNKIPRLVTFSKFFPKNIVAFVSDRTIDFARQGDTLRLTQKQKSFLSRAVGLSIIQLPNIKQIHGKRIIVAKKPSCLGLTRLNKADGIITNKSGMPLSVRTADCLSIFLFDKKNNATGLVHAGWKGTKKNIAPRAVSLMKKHFGTKPKDLKAAFGPSIQKCCYEVGAEFRRHFPGALIKKGARLYLDLPLVNKRQLIRAGVKARNISGSGACTCCDRRFFSFRREGEKAGRMISFMMLKS